MNALLAALLKATFALYASSQNPAFSEDLRMQAYALADRALLVYQKASTPWMDFRQLANAQYRNLDGTLLQLRNERFVSAAVSAEIIPEHTSFGDLNKDLLDDAVVVLRVRSGGGDEHYLLAAVLNMNQGVVRNAAILDLGRTVEIFDHRIQNGEFKLDIQADGASRATKLYKLEGDALKLVSKI